MRFSQLNLVASIAFGLNVAVLIPLTLFITEILWFPAVAQAAADPMAEANRLLEQGAQRLSTRQYQEAIQLFQDALIIFQNIGNRNSEAVTLDVLGIAHELSGQPQQAIDSYQQALAIYRDIGSSYTKAGLLLKLGAIYRASGQYQQAIDSYQQALAIYRDSHMSEVNILMLLGSTYRASGQYQQAINSYQEALPIFQAMGGRDSEGMLLANIGRLYADQTDPISAIEQLQKSVEVRESIRAGLRDLPQADQQAYTDSIADDYRFLAELLKQQNRNQEAQAVLDLL